MDARIDVDAYLARIVYTGSREPLLETLRGLQWAHLLAVPFENLDLHPPFKREIVLEPCWLEAKIVAGRRGGFCYELNGLFAVLLEALGFQVTRLSAGVRRKTGGFGPDFDHLLLRVDIGGEPWLADVGFGDLSLEPLRLRDAPQRDETGALFRIEPDGAGHVLYRSTTSAETWEPQYRFTLDAHALDDFNSMCHVQQTSPESAFTRGRVCSRYTPYGRISLSDSRLIVTERGERTEVPMSSDDAFMRALAAHFGIAPVPVR